MKESNTKFMVDLQKLGTTTDKEVERIKKCRVPTPCTLTDAVRKGYVITIDKFSDYMGLEDEQHSIETIDEVEHFKENHLYKEEDKTLKNMIYELGLDSRHEVEMIQAYERELKRVGK